MPSHQKFVKRVKWKIDHHLRVKWKTDHCWNLVHWAPVSNGRLTNVGTSLNGILVCDAVISIYEHFPMVNGYFLLPGVTDVWKYIFNWFFFFSPKNANTTKIGKIAKNAKFRASVILAFFAILPIFEVFALWDFCVICVIFGNEKTTERWDFTSSGVCWLGLSG